MIVQFSMTEHFLLRIVQKTQSGTVLFLIILNYLQKIVLTFVPDWDIPLFVQQQAPDGCRVPPSEREHYRIFLYFDQNDGSCSDSDNQLSGLASGPTPETRRGARGKQQSCGVRSAGNPYFDNNNCHTGQMMTPRTCLSAVLILMQNNKLYFQFNTIFNNALKDQNVSSGKKCWSHHSCKTQKCYTIQLLHRLRNNAPVWRDTHFISALFLKIAGSSMCWC